MERVRTNLQVVIIIARTKYLFPQFVGNPDILEFRVIGLAFFFRS